jgi:hypothetical protein
MSDQFDLLQTALAFSFAAGRAENVWGTNIALLDFFGMALKDGGTYRIIYKQTEPTADDVPSELQVTGFLHTVGPRLLGQDWEITWGPCIFADPSRTLSPNRITLANGMFVAHSHNANAYIVAISPTNFASRYAFRLMDGENAPENAVDFPVDLSGTVVPRAGNHTDRMQLTGGTGLGVFNLCQMFDPLHQGGIGPHLVSLRPKPDTKLIFAGHSLGGALAPSLALQFRGLLTRWAPENIMVLATAGATPGNTKFTDEWNGKFLPKAVESPNTENGLRDFNTLHWNTLDFVPYAFTNLHGLETVYWNKHDLVLGSKVVDCPLGHCTDDLNADENTASAVLQDYARLCRLSKLQNTPFTGNWPVNYWGSDGSRRTYPTPDGTIPGPGNTVSHEALLFAKQRAHMEQYLAFAGIDPWDIPPPVSIPG